MSYRGVNKDYSAALSLKNGQEVGLPHGIDTMYP